MTATLREYCEQRLRRDDGGCWMWTGFIQRDGYGVIFSRHRRHALAHRVMYELYRGEIPAGLVVDHLCRNRACVNPAHMEPVTIVENIWRGVAPAAQNKRKTHCKYGHELSVDNTYTWNGKRACRACGKRKTREYLQRQRSASMQVAA